MSATDDPGAAGDRCGKWMPRKRANCARMLGHKSECRSAEALADRRWQKTLRRRGGKQKDDPAAVARWRRAHKFKRLGITEDEFNELLAAQGYRCGICRQPFGETRRVCADHDHACHEKSDRSAKACRKCIRGLLCVPCNTGLGFLEDCGEKINAYLTEQPASFLRSVGRSGIEPLTPKV